MRVMVWNIHPAVDGVMKIEVIFLEETTNLFEKFQAAVEYYVELARFRKHRRMLLPRSWFLICRWFWKYDGTLELNGVFS